MEHTFTNTSKLIDVFRSKGIDTDELLNELNLYKKAQKQSDMVRSGITIVLGVIMGLITFSAMILNMWSDPHLSIMEIIVLSSFMGILIIMMVGMMAWLLGSLLACSYEGILSLFKVGYFYQSDKCLEIIKTYNDVLDQLQDEHRLNQVLFASLSTQVVLFDKNNEDILNGTKITVPDEKIQAFYMSKEDTSFVGRGILLLSYLDEVPDYITLKKINERLERLLAQ